MKTIAVCGSMKFIKSMEDVASKLKKFGYNVLMPVEMKHIDYWQDSDHKLKVRAKQEYDLIRKHFRKIEKSDAILIINNSKGKIKNYIGANTFLELGYAYYLNKKIFLLNNPSKQKYILDELKSMDAVVLSGNIENIKNYY